MNGRDTRAGIQVFLPVEPDAQTVESGQGPFPDHRGVLADPAGEHQAVHPAEHGQVGADVVPEPVTEHVQGQRGPVIALPGRAGDGPHVMTAADPFQTAFPVGQPVQLLDGQPGLPGQIKENGRIKVPAAGPHDQPGQGGHAHGGVDTLTAPDRGDAGAVAQMHGDAVESGRIKAQENSGLAAHERV